MTGSFFHQGYEADENPEPLALSDALSEPDSGISPAIEHKLEELNIPIPQEIELPSDSEPSRVESFTTLEQALADDFGHKPTGNPKDLLGIKKPDLSLVPAAATIYTAQAFADGAAKYGPYNWRENPVKARVYVAAALRHINQYLDGENVDPLSGVPHIGHALACFAILADATETGNLIDDRPVTGPAGDLLRRLTKD